MEKQVESESRLSFIEATSIIIGHGVGSGILAVPYLASRVSWQAVLGIVALAYVINLILHLLIAELALNNGGRQFIKCFESELFTGKLKKLFTSLAFAMLGLSVLMNVSGFIAGSAAVLESWLGLSPRLAMIIYYVASAAVVFFGMKSVGIFEKVAVSAMAMVIAALFTATLTSPISQLPAITKAPGNLLALYSMVSFSLSAVMSVPQVVKGLDGDPRAIRLSIVAGTGANTAMLLAVTFMTLLGAGSSITQKGALVDLSAHLGGWVSVIGYIFSLLALTTSLWASTLNLRDIVSEQTGPEVSHLRSLRILGLSDSHSAGFPFSHHRLRDSSGLALPDELADEPSLPKVNLAVCSAESKAEGYHVDLDLLIKDAVHVDDVLDSLYGVPVLADLDHGLDLLVWHADA
ncbi:MAG: aromatic amino acid transport family protein [Sphaerochaetaceae bacterium]|jgi:amino acid permease|nr:aromatic amino acid transport family protein [Sphaerochaetaceae bacterium]